jgi:hypothetical protein
MLIKWELYRVFLKYVATLALETRYSYKVSTEKCAE